MKSGGKLVRLITILVLLSIFMSACTSKQLVEELTPTPIPTPVIPTKLGLFRQIVEQEHITLLMSSHDPLVDGYVDQILQMQDGQII